MKAEIGTFPKNRQILREIVPLDTPLEFDFHVTGVCNFRCNYCLWSSPPDAMKKQAVASVPFMDEKTFETAVEQIKRFPRKIKHITLTGGEPTLHERLAEMVEAVNNADITDYTQVISNGTRLTPQLGRELVKAGLNEIKISLNGLNAEKYAEITGAGINWDEFYENIRYFSSIRENCKLKIKIADTALDEGDEEKFYSLFGDIADAVAVEHIYDAWAVNGINYSGSPAEHKKTRYGYDYRDIKVCKSVFIYLDVLPDGMIATRCHRDMGWGNVNSTALTEVWNGEKLDKLRKDMLLGRAKHESCTVNASTAHPEDILDGYEDEILSRMEKGIFNGGK
jgi:MoaA/NifB/PqqE/SkfB family radical SAM enzyme